MKASVVSFVNLLIDGNKIKINPHPLSGLMMMPCLNGDID